MPTRAAAAAEPLPHHLRRLPSARRRRRTRNAARFERLAIEGGRCDPTTRPRRTSAWPTPSRSGVGSGPSLDAADEAFLQPEIERLESFASGCTRTWRTRSWRSVAIAMSRPGSGTSSLPNAFASACAAQLVVALLPFPRARPTRCACSRMAGGCSASELGIDPRPRAATARGMGASPGPAARCAVDPTAARNPYKGLRPFGEADEGDFFGREALGRAARRPPGAARARRPPPGRRRAVGKRQVERRPGRPRAGNPSRRAAGIGALAGRLDAARRAPVTGARICALGGTARGGGGGVRAAEGGGRRWCGDRRRRRGRGADPGDGDAARPARSWLVIDQAEELFTLADDATRARFCPIARCARAVRQPPARRRHAARRRAGSSAPGAAPGRAGPDRPRAGDAARSRRPGTGDRPAGRRRRGVVGTRPGERDHRRPGGTSPASCRCSSFALTSCSPEATAPGRRGPTMRRPAACSEPSPAAPTKPWQCSRVRIASLPGSCSCV